MFPMFSLMWIMPPRVMTRSAGRPAAAPQGGETGGRIGRESRRVREPRRRKVKPTGEPEGQGNDQVNQGSNQGDNRNQSGTAINDNIWGDIEKMKSVQDINGCEVNQKVKYTASSFVGKALTWWNSLIHTRGREAAVGMSWEDFKTLTKEEFCPSNEMQKLETELWNHAIAEAGHAAYTDRFHELARLMVAAMKPTTIQKAVQIASTLTDEAIRNGSIKKNPEKRENGGELNKDRNGNVNPINARNLTARACYECGSTDHFKATCPRLNQAQRPGGNHQNQVVAVNGGQGRGSNGNQAYGRAFMLGAKEARQDPNIMTSTFTLNNHYSTTLFNSGADYSFVSTTFIPMLGVEANDLGFSYEIKIASGQLIEIDKVIKGYKLEIEGYKFDINLIPFRSGSFDAIIGMDWFSNHKTEIICHKKVIRIPLPDDKVLRVIGERLEKNMRHLVSAKAKERKQEEMVMVRDFPKVFLDDLSGLPHIQEIKFRIQLVPEVIPEVQFLGHVINGNGIHVDPSKIKAVKNQESPRTSSEVHSFLGLAGYYRQFIEKFSKISKSLTILTQKSKTFDWDEEQERAFQTLKDMLCNTPVLALPDGLKDFVVHCDAYGLGLVCMLMQRGKVIAYGSRQLRIHEKNYTTHDLELGLQKGLDEMIEHRSDGALYYLDRIWVLLKGDVRTLIMDEAHKSKYSIHPGADKMYYDLRDRYWWSGMKKDIEDYKMDRLARLYLNEIVARHGVPISIISDHDSRFTSRFWQSMQEALGARLDMSTTYLPQTDGQSERTIQTLEGPALGHKCRLPLIMWAKVREGQLIGPELVQETTEKISQINDRLKVASCRQKSYADKRRKPLEFSVRLDEMIEHRIDGALYYLDQIWVPLKGDVRTLIMDEAYKSKYSIHPGVDKMYYDLKDRPSGLLQQLEIPKRKWEMIAMDFVMKLLKTSSRHDTI
ncbi:putative reverse transcriptase domain-containing protein [Tanacetum coccineum]